MVAWKKTMMTSASGADAWFLQIWNDDDPTGQAPAVTALSSNTNAPSQCFDLDSNGDLALLVNVKYEAGVSDRWMPSLLKFDSNGNNTANRMIGLYSSVASPAAPSMLQLIVNRSNNNEVIVMTVPVRDNNTRSATIIGYSSDLSTVNFTVGSPSSDFQEGYTYLPNEDHFLLHNGANYVYRFDAADFGNTGGATLYRTQRSSGIAANVLTQNAFSYNVSGSLDAAYEMLLGSNNSYRAFANRYNLSGRFAVWNGQIYFSQGQPNTNFGGITSTYTPGASTSATYDMVATFGAHTINSSYENVFVVKCAHNSQTITDSAQTFLTQTNQNWRSGGIVCDSSGNVYLSCYYRQDDFFVLKLDSDLNLDTCLRFYRIGESSSRDLTSRSNLKVSDDGSFLYVPINNPYLPTAAGYARDFSILKMPTDMSLTGAFDWPARAGGFAPYANQTSNISQLGIQDVTSSCSVSSASVTMSSFGSSESFSNFTLPAVTNLTQYSQDLTYFGSASGNFSYAEPV